MKKGLKLEELEEGTIYKCILSEHEMLVVKTRKQNGQESTGKKDDDDKDIMIPTFVDVYAGKFIQEQNEVKQFAFNELHDGQLEELQTNNN